MPTSNRELLYFVVQVCREPRIRITEVHDFFMHCAKGNIGIKDTLIHSSSATHSQLVHHAFGPIRTKELTIKAVIFAEGKMGKNKQI